MTEQSARLRIGIQFLLAVLITGAIYFFTSSAIHGQTAKSPAAADLVKDGQLIDIASPKYTALFDELISNYQFTRQELTALFSGLTIHRKVLVLMDKQWEAKPYYKYWPIFINRSVISKGKKKLQEHKALFDRIEKEIGVEREIITAIWAIESKFGTHKGSFNVFRTLNTLFDAYPRRSDFFREELIQFLLLCRDNKIDPRRITGSYAGAFGQTQFISSSYRKYAVDFDQNGIKDIFHSTDDVLASIANYLHSFGWRFGETLYQPLGRKLYSESLNKTFEEGRSSTISWTEIVQSQKIDIPRPYNDSPLTIVGLERSPFKGGGMDYFAGYPNFQAITEWNHSNRYAMAVSQLAENLRK